jgi:heat shock protein HtpX
VQSVQNLQAHSSTGFYAEIAENKRRTLLFFALFVLGFLVLGGVVGIAAGVLVVGLAVGLVLGVAVALFSFYRSDGIALARNRAVPAPAGEHPRYHNLVEGLCIAAGLPKPRLYIVDDPGLNAFVTGRNPKHAAVALTRGMLDSLGRIELEGVLACELSHVKNYDILVSTAAVVPTILLGRLGAVMAYGSRSPDHDLYADASGVQITRYPPGLSSALKKVQAGGGAVRHASRATAPMWLTSPYGRDDGDGPRRAGGAGSRLPLEERIRILDEM